MCIKMNMASMENKRFICEKSQEEVEIKKGFWHFFPFFFFLIPHHHVSQFMSALLYWWKKSGTKEIIKKKIHSFCSNEIVSCAQQVGDRNNLQPRKIFKKIFFFCFNVTENSFVFPSVFKRIRRGKKKKER